MINVMRDLALLALNDRFGCARLTVEQLREEYAKEFATLLVEASEKIPRAYLLQAIPDKPGAVRMWPEDLDEDKRRRLPFNKPSGSQSAAIGPVFKRTYKRGERPPYGPSPKIQSTTEDAFQSLTAVDQEWKLYFQEVYDILFKNKGLIYQEKLYPVEAGSEDTHVLAAAVRLIPERETVFLGVVDSAGRWPGDRPEYHAYLAHELAEIKYKTEKALSYAGADCPLCGKARATLYPNALKGAGINFSNMDREGAFPGLDIEQAWKGYGLCLDCADLLYIFKNHVLQEFTGRVAGENALLLSSLLGSEPGKQQFIKDWRGYIRNLTGDKIKAREKDLMEFFLDQDDAHVVLHILWAKFGQVIEDVRGYVTDILPSRLQALAEFNAQANRWNHALAPKHPLEEAPFNLSLSVLASLFKRPGGDKAKKSNASAHLFALKRQLADALYHGTRLGEAGIGLWRELLTTACWYLDHITASDNGWWGLLHEGVSVKNDKPIYYWTLAGWVRHLARFLFYLDITGVLPMDQTVFDPQMEKLKPYFKPGSGINSPEKAFTFLLGILYGKVIQVQGARGVDVGSNSLTWLKRLNLAGRDLPELYNRIREKLLTYGVEANADVRALIQEIGRLGAHLGDAIALDATATCYFLLLGQSITVEILPSKSKKEDEE